MIIRESTESPTISVVIPLYNKRFFVSSCLESIGEQTFKDFEIIVVDDGSTDGSAEVAQVYLRCKDRLIRQRNAGVSAARNKGIAESRGKYVTFLDADDKWEPGYLEAVVDLADRYPEAGILATGYRMQFPKGRAVEVTISEVNHHQTHLVFDYFRRSIGWAFIWTGCITIPRKVLTMMEGFPANVPGIQSEDLDLWSRIALRYPIAYDTRILAVYNLGIPGQYASRLHDFSRNPIGCLPYIRFLHSVVAESWVAASLRNDILAYIKNQLIECAYYILRTANRSAFMYWLRDTLSTFPCPWWVKLLRLPTMWALLQLWAMLRRLLSSRFLLSLMGGERVSHGVIRRLR